MSPTNSEDAPAEVYESGQSHETSTQEASTAAAVETAEPEPEEEDLIVDPGFDLLAVENPSFNALEGGRAEVYETPRKLTAFKRRVAALASAGEEGRRKGLGLWMIADFEGAVKQLSNYESDDVASFTLAQCHMTLRNFTAAEPIFARLSKAYPDEPRPRCGLLEAALERDLVSGGEDGVEAAAETLLDALEASQPSFMQSAEYHYLAGRVHELSRHWGAALDEYEAARQKHPGLRANLFRGAFLAERCGLDEVALEFYEGLAKLRPIDAHALINLGVLYEDLGRDKDAAGCYDTLVNHAPTDTRARLYLADAKASLGMYYDEDLERKEDRLNQILRIPITDFELSVRARNCLNKMQILSLGDLVCKTEQELLAYKNFGETSLNEIKEILRSKGLRLGMPREEAVASIEARGSQTTSSGDQSDVLNRPIHELQISIRARRTVETLGCLTLGDAIKHSADELLGMPNFGATSLQELRSKLAEFGLKLRGD